MGNTNKLVQFYFDCVYNRVYDLATGQLNIYRRLQEKCIGKLKLEDNDCVLCVGLGTGNEILRVLEINRNVSITGIDYSSTALRNTRKKALKLGKEIELILMDAQCLEFATGSFNKVLCLHVMDFVNDDVQVTSEIIRVLKEGGQFAITYPSLEEGASLGTNILKDSFHNNIKSRNCIIGFFAFLAQMFLGLVYIPLLFRQKRKPYSRGQLETLFSGLITGAIQIEEDPDYHDFILYGKKPKGG